MFCQTAYILNKGSLTPFNNKLSPLSFHWDYWPLEKHHEPLKEEVVWICSEEKVGFCPLKANLKDDVWERSEFIIFLTYLCIPLNSKFLAHLFGSKMFVFSICWHFDDLPPFSYLMNPLERVELLEPERSCFGIDFVWVCDFPGPSGDQVKWITTLLPL